MKFRNRRVINPIFFLQTFLFILVLLLFNGCKKREVLLTYQEQQENQPTIMDGDKTDPVVDTEEAEEVKSIYIHICGAVVKPGIYELEEGSRIYEAVEAAGGYLPQASRDYLNQAKLLQDEEKIVVYTRTEIESWTKEETLDAPLAGEQDRLQSAKEPERENNKTESSQVNINQADLEELMTLPGIGASRAQLIIDYREVSGPFEKPEDIQNVNGIKEGLYSKLKEFIKVK